jgi:type IV secretory pathway component VirB8
MYSVYTADTKIDGFSCKSGSRYIKLVFGLFVVIAIIIAIAIVILILVF